MPTLKQKEAVKSLVGNGGSITKAMREAKYAEATINTPQKLTESRGYKEELAKYGLTEKLVTAALVTDIESKPQNRLGEMRLGAEILGMNKKEGDSGNKTLIVMISSESAQRFKINEAN